MAPQASRSQPVRKPRVLVLAVKRQVAVLKKMDPRKTRVKKRIVLRRMMPRKMKTIRKNPVLSLRSVDLICLMALFTPILSWADGVGTITHLSGTIQAHRADGTNKILSVKSEIKEGDTLKTEVNTFARIKFLDGGEVVLRPETVFKVEAYSYKPVPVEGQKDSVSFNLLKGGIRSVTGLLGKRSPDSFKVNTAAATIGIRGTHFGALLCNNDCANIPTISGSPPGNGLHTDTASGSTVISNAAGTVEVPAGSFSYTQSPVVAPKLVPPAAGVQVTMPPSISSNKASGGGMGKTNNNACTVN
jgi:hypothetical protein